MKHVLLLLVVSMGWLTGACSESDCEKYAKMEWDCGDFPESEKDMTLKLAEGMCEMAQKDTSDEAKMVREMFTAELACAKSAKNCSEYEACKNKANHVAPQE